MSETNVDNDRVEFPEYLVALVISITVSCIRFLLLTESMEYYYVFKIAGNHYLADGGMIYKIICIILTAAASYCAWAVIHKTCPEGYALISIVFFGMGNFTSGMASSDLTFTRLGLALSIPVVLLPVALITDKKEIEDDGKISLLFAVIYLVFLNTTQYDWIKPIFIALASGYIFMAVHGGKRPYQITGWVLLIFSFIETFILDVDFLDTFTSKIPNLFSIMLLIVALSWMVWTETIKLKL